MTLDHPTTIRPTDADASVTAWPSDLDTPFMRFWHDLNKTFAAHSLPQVLYGEARDLYGRRTWDSRPRQDDEDDEPNHDRCTSPDGHSWVEGPPDRGDEGPIRCEYCGADGDA